MTEAGPTKADAFEAHRRHLTGLAYRMLGSLADAEDVVQEGLLRPHRAEGAGSTAGPGPAAESTPALTEDELVARVKSEFNAEEVI